MLDKSMCWLMQCGMLYNPISEKENYYSDICWKKSV